MKLGSLHDLFEDLGRSAAVQIRHREGRCDSDIRRDFGERRLGFGAREGAEAEVEKRRCCLTYLLLLIPYMHVADV
jgi:hypothetical protein